MGEAARIRTVSLTLTLKSPLLWGIEASVLLLGTKSPESLAQIMAKPRVSWSHLFACLLHIIIMLICKIILNGNEHVPPPSKLYLI